MSERLPKNVKIIETPEANFRIIYGAHFFTSPPAGEFGSADALALEYMRDYTIKENIEKKMEKWKEDVQYELIIKEAVRQNKPIFFVDAKADVAMMMQIGLIGIEIYVGYRLLRSLVKDIISRRKISRREVLKRSVKGIAGLYFFSHLTWLLPALDPKIDERSKRRAVERFIMDFNEKIHPETWCILLTLRNHLMAQKLKTIAERIRQSKKEKPEIAIAIGGGHIGIEKALLKQEKERIALVNKLLRVPGLRKARDKIATIVRLDFDKEQNKWIVTEIFKDPYLSAIERNK